MGLVIVTNNNNRNYLTQKGLKRITTMDGNGSLFKVIFFEEQKRDSMDSTRRGKLDINFINMFMCSFDARRSHKHKKLLDLTVFFALLGSVRIKAARKHIDEIDRLSQILEEGPIMSDKQTNKKANKKLFPLRRKKKLLTSLSLLRRSHLLLSRQLSTKVYSTECITNLDQKSEMIIFESLFHVCDIFFGKLRQ